MAVPYVQCLVCGRVTPVDRGVCYHCGAPLPSEIMLPRGMVVCPNCLRVTSAAGGYCRHCKYRLPEEVLEAAGVESRGGAVPGRVLGVFRVGVVGALAVAGSAAGRVDGGGSGGEGGDGPE